MKKVKSEKLKAKGWQVGTVADFLQLSPEEERVIDLRLALSGALKQVRVESGQTQQDVAKLLRTSQSRIAKMEAGDSSVSIDLLIRGLFSCGIDNRQLSEIIALLDM
jgi:DNA-binding XRE family transcriptional regulator